MSDKPWTHIEVSQEKLDELWNKFQDIKNNAHELKFPILYMLDLRYRKWYEDLHEQWDEYNAQMLYYTLYRDLQHNGYVE